MLLFNCLALFFVFSLADPDVGKSMVEIVKSKGYKIESHSVTTEDGYILGMFRIPPRSPGAPVVLLQHGLLDSSWTWVCNFPGQSLGFMLADAGYDVWFGNSRGNVYSLRHVKYPVDSDEFWDFSFDEMAKYDLPAQINHALSISNKKTLSYVGHSQAFAAFSGNHTISSRVNLFVALAPVAYVGNAGGLLPLMADLDIDFLFQLLGVRQFLPDSSWLQRLAPQLCVELGWACEDMLFWIAGSTNHLNETRIPVYTSETPAGTSVKNMAHWAQASRDKAFQMYDYGCGILTCENEEHYGQQTPPQYKLKNLAVPTAIYYGGQDVLADPTDVKKMLSEIPDQYIVTQVFQDTYAHLDFTWGMDAYKLLYADVLRMISKYNH